MHAHAAQPGGGTHLSLARGGALALRHAGRVVGVGLHGRRVGATGGARLSVERSAVGAGARAYLGGVPADELDGGRMRMRGLERARGRRGGAREQRKEESDT